MQRFFVFVQSISGNGALFFLIVFGLATQDLPLA